MSMEIDDDPEYDDNLTEREEAGLLEIFQRRFFNRYCFDIDGVSDWEWGLLICAMAPLADGDEYGNPRQRLEQGDLMMLVLLGLRQMSFNEKTPADARRTKRISERIDAMGMAGVSGATRERLVWLGLQWLESIRRGGDE